MSRRKSIPFILMILSIVMAGCNVTTDNRTTMEKIQEQLHAIENYVCTASVMHISNKGRNEYETRQYYKKSGEYRVEMLAPEHVKGIVTIFDGKTVNQYNPRVEGKITYDVEASRDRDEMFLGSFLKNYLQSEEVTVAVVNTEEGKATVLEAVVPGNHPYLSTEKLWIDNKTLKPIQLIIYDPQGGERVIVTFQEIAYNVDLKEALFRLSQ